MKIALCQLNMHWTIDDNVKSIAIMLVQAAKQGAEVAIFPECSVTGYHRMLPKTVNKKSIEAAVQQLQNAATANNISIIVGSPFFRTDKDGIENSVLLIQPNKKDIQINSKIGLTEPEKMFFTKSENRSNLQFNGKKIGVIFCREILDIKELLNDFSEMELDFIIWPSYIKWDDFENPETAKLGKDYLKSAQKISKQLSLPIYNINSANALNDAITGMGFSKIIENGQLVRSGKKDKEDLQVISIA